MDVFERARRYVAKMPPAISGSAGHNATFSVAVALVKRFDLPLDQARAILEEFNQRCEPPWSHPELEHKLTSAAGVEDDRPRGWLIGEADESRKVVPFVRPADMPAPSRPEPKAEFVNEKLKQFAARWRGHVDTAWLADRSPIDPLRVNSAEFLSHLYQPGEHVVTFADAAALPQSQGQALWPINELPRSGANGVWFLVQPVDGEYHPNPRSLDKEGQPKLSRRSEESVTAWRYLVIESDEADPRDWMGALVQLPLAIAAVYTSAGRSIHALVKVDAKRDLNEWRNFSRAIKPVLVTLGADKQVIVTAVRLSRLPGCFREGRFKDDVYERFRSPQLQKLLYLNPAPAALPICAMPKVRDVIDYWTNAALRHLKCDAAEIVERHLRTKGARFESGAFVGVKLEDCIEALERHADDSLFSESLRDCLHALNWFATSEKAKTLLRKFDAI